MSLADRLRDRRKHLGLTNGQVATYLGISRAHVSEMERGKSNPSLDLLARIARYYRTTADYLLEITDDPRLPNSNGDVPAGYSQRDSLAIMEELPDELRELLTRFAISLRDFQVVQRERALGQFIMGILGGIEDRFGEDAAQELEAAIESFTRTGEDSALRAWFTKYLGPDNLLPN